jgi:hypothetical protein
MVPAEAAGPVKATCGATITGDAYLAGDLSCDTYDNSTAITVAADATLDLRGHRLLCAEPCSGKGALSNPYPVGVEVRPGVHAKVVNGRIDNFGLGVGAGYTPENITSTIDISGVTFTRNSIGIGSRADFNVTRSRFTGNGFGYFVLDPAPKQAVNISKSVFRHQEFAAVYGSGETITVSNTLFTRNRSGFETATVASGDVPAGGVYSLKRNVFLQNQRDGVYIAPTTPQSVTLKGNLAVRNGGHAYYVPGAKDGGANKAVGNGASPQCVGVSCSRN